MAEVCRLIKRLIACVLAASIGLVGLVMSPTVPVAAADDLTNHGVGGGQPAVVIDRNDLPVFVANLTTFSPIASAFSIQIVRCLDASCTTAATAELQGRYFAPSLVIDQNDRPVIAALDADSKQAVVFRCTNPACSSITELDLPEASTDTAPSLALDANDRPIVAFAAATTREVVVVRCGNAFCTAGNSVAVADDEAQTNLIGPLRMSSAGLPVLAYLDLVSEEVRVLRCGNLDCTDGNIIDSVGRSGAVTLSLSLTPADVPAIALGGLGGGIVLRICSDPSCASFTSAAIDEVRDGVIGQTSLTLDANANPVLAYLRISARNIEIARCIDPTCSGPISIEALETESTAGQGPSLALDEQSKPVVAFEDLGLRRLRLLRCNDANCQAEPDLLGDANCDGEVNGIDAYATALFAVDLARGVARCVDVVLRDDISLAAITVDEQDVSILNAYWISQCVVGLGSPLCPAE